MVMTNEEIVPTPNQKETLKLTALRFIKDWLPLEGFNAGDAIEFANKVQALLEFLEGVC